MKTSKGELIAILPKTVYVADDVCPEYNEKFKEEIYSLWKDNAFNNNDYFNVYSSHHEKNSLHRITPFKQLTKVVEEHIYEFLLTYGYNDFIARNIRVSQMWFNIGEKGNYLFPHTHPGSFISGAFYVQTNEENWLQFYDPNKFSAVAQPDNFNDLSTNMYPVKCKDNRLLLFHSDLHHDTIEQQCERHKIVISFNTTAMFWKTGEGMA
tara:strand:+ start:710 stop:1336 length:627 start_codon:yes stop_codon:yes gene_type:complete